LIQKVLSLRAKDGRWCIILCTPGEHVLNKVVLTDSTGRPGPLLLQPLLFLAGCSRIDCCARIAVNHNLEKSSLRNSTTSMVFVGKKKTRRKAAYPRSILEKAALSESLEEAGVVMKQLHVDNFYQALHRQHYPPLPEFVDNYYKFERKETLDTEKPLKNKMTTRKCKNLVQLPKAFLEFLRKTPDFVTCTSKVQQKLTSQDKSTTKLIVELHDGQVVESVLMRYERKGSGRASLCVSSQCGCAMGCTFCATGTMGLSGNLTAAEILEQLVHADSILAEEYEAREDKSKKLDLVRNIVFMGMGEPLDNYSNVVGACRAMMDRRRWNLAHGRVTVSTVGLVSQIRKLTKELPEVSLALSLHAPNQEMRTAIVPTAARYPIEQLIDALDNHMLAYLKKRTGDQYTEAERIKESSRRRAMIEYVMRKFRNL
jgi:adenine C2-methylase RlmN of 23S rRNA A2503 and tRNA A37